MSEPPQGAPTADETRSCCDCGREFIFTRGEQAFYAKHGFLAPRRCSACRVTRKTRYTTYASRGDRPHL